jgi:hypothetical protein
MLFVLIYEIMDQVLLIVNETISSNLRSEELANVGCAVHTVEVMVGGVHFRQSADKQA